MKTAATTTTATIIATAATVGSGAYEKRIRETLSMAGDDRQMVIHSQACPLFVPLVEEGETDSEIARLVAAKYLSPIKAEGIDTLVLGCTHYPLLKSVIAETMGPEVTLVDSAEAAAAETARHLKDHGMLRTEEGRGEEHFYVTDAARRFHRIAETFLGHAPENLELAELGAV